MGQNNRNLRGFHFARAQTAQGALRGNFADMLRRFQTAQAARHRKPVIALHAAVFALRDGNGGDRTIRALVFAYESVGVGQDFVPSGSIERAAVGILDARVVIERGFSARRA